MHGILLSGGADIDVMVHGLLKYSFFGHEVWITTTHVCLLLVMLILIGFSIADYQLPKAGLPAFPLPQGRSLKRGQRFPERFRM